MSVNHNYINISTNLPGDVTLLAVSKRHSLDAIMQVYGAGCRDFGEDRHQELLEKVANAPEDIRWHFIGNMQSKKAKYIVPVAHLIHSVVSPSVVEAIDKHALKIGKVQDILLQIHISQDETKSGFSVEEFREFVKGGSWRDMPGVRLRGVMAMGSFDVDEGVVRGEFEQVQQLFSWAKGVVADNSFDTISMGMSDDYKVAIECGSTIVRIGSTIFGMRDYTKSL